MEDIKLRKRKGEKAKRKMELTGGLSKKHIRILEAKKSNKVTIVTKLQKV